MRRESCRQWSSHSSFGWSILLRSVALLSNEDISYFRYAFGIWNSGRIPVIKLENGHAQTSKAPGFSVISRCAVSLGGTGELHSPLEQGCTDGHLTSQSLFIKWRCNTLSMALKPFLLWPGDFPSCTNLYPGFCGFIVAVILLSRENNLCATVANSDKMEGCPLNRRHPGSVQWYLSSQDCWVIRGLLLLLTHLIKPYILKIVQPSILQTENVNIHISFSKLFFNVTISLYMLC